MPEGESARLKIQGPLAMVRGLDPDPTARRPRLLLFEQRMIGDAVMSLPFIRSAESMFDVHVTCAEHSAAIFRMVMPEEKIVVWTPPWLEGGKPGGGGRDRLVPYLQRLRARRAEVAASVWADARVHGLMRLSGARRRVGFPMTARNFYASQLPWRKKQIRIGAVLSVLGSIFTLGPLLTKKVNRQDYYQHHVDDFRNLAAALEVPWDERRPWLPLPGAAAAAAQQMVWLVHPGARFAGRRWPLRLFADIVREALLPRGAAVLFIRPPELRDARIELPPEVKIIEPASLADFLEVCARADVLLCNDTGVSHMGAALGKKVVSIFSDQEPRWFAPRGSEALAVQKEVCPYRPCLDHCVMPSYICLEAVTYEMVRAKVLSLFPERGAELS